MFVTDATEKVRNSPFIKEVTNDDDLGHYLGDCPTNEDPTYDLAPGDNYECKHCKKCGDHYFLFCPQNPDSNSVYKRRQAKAHGEAHEQQGAKQNTKSSPLPNRELFTSWLTTITSNVPAMDSFPAGPRQIKVGMGSKNITTVESKHLILPEHKIRLSDRFGKENAPLGQNREAIESGLSLLPQPIRDSESYNCFRSLTKTPLEKRSNALMISRSLAGNEEENETSWEKERIRNDSLRRGNKRGWKQSEITSKPVIGPVSMPESRIQELLNKLLSKRSRKPRKMPRLTAMDMWNASDAKKLDEVSEADQEMANLFLEGSHAKSHAQHPGIEPVDGLCAQVDWYDKTSLDATEVSLWEVSDGRQFREEAGEFIEETTKAHTMDVTPEEMDSVIQDLFVESRQYSDSVELPKEDKAWKTLHMKPNLVIQRGRIWIHHLELKLLEDQQSRNREVSDHDLRLSPLSMDDPEVEELQRAIQKKRRSIEKANKQLINVAVLRERLELGHEVDGDLVGRMTSKKIAERYVQYISREG